MSDLRELNQKVILDHHRQVKCWDLRHPKGFLVTISVSRAMTSK